MKSHNVLRTRRCGPLPGTIANPVTIFREILSPEIVEIVVRETNRRAEQSIANWNAKNPSCAQIWAPTCAEEMYAFFGMLLFAGLWGSNSQPIDALWAAYQPPIYKGTMAKNRFKNLLRFIRFDDSATRPERLLASKSAPIDEMWMMVMANLERMYTPHENLTVDEQLFGYRGRTRFTQYIPSKPAKYGMKVWWLADARTHYPLKGIIYTGKLEGAAREKNQGENVVLKLVAKYRHTGRTVYCDNFFTTTNLAVQLMSSGLAIVGTVRPNKRFVPDEFRKHRPRELYSTMFAYQNDIALCSYANKPRKVVLVLLTVHYDSTVDTLSLAAKPQQITDYNQNKAGVGILANGQLGGGRWLCSSTCWTYAVWHRLLFTMNCCQIPRQTNVVPSLSNCVASWLGLIWKRDAERRVLVAFRTLCLP